VEVLDTPLTTLNLPNVGTFGARRIEDTALTVLSLPALRGVGTERGGSLEIVNTAITRFEAPLRRCPRRLAEPGVASSNQ
jgi:hypothetical protein